MNLFHHQAGDSPLIVSIPHAGTHVPRAIAAGLSPAGRALEDTDWHVDKLLAFLGGRDVTVLTATHSRYVVDLNRGPDGRLLYPGQAETAICPAETFAGVPIYAAGPPGPDEVAARVAAYWQPFHDALAGEIARLRARHGRVHVLDAHSIHATIPRLFEGTLPDLNVGTHDGASADAALSARVMEAVAGQGFSHVLNGRFKGGYITRHYGAPAQGVHVVQLEMAWRTYLEEREPTRFEVGRAANLIALLHRVIDAIAEIL